jgi:hypothetical protein
MFRVQSSRSANSSRSGIDGGAALSLPSRVHCFYAGPIYGCGTAVYTAFTRL